MDNQQERFDVELAWLAGIIEGEGWISLIYYKSNQRNGRYTSCLKGVIGVCNTDMILMDKVIEILDKHHIKYQKQIIEPHEKSPMALRKPKKEVSVLKQEALRNLSVKILPYVFGAKKTRLIHLMRFLEIRLSKPRTGPKAKYGKEEFLLYKDMYSYKGHSRSKILNDLTLDEIIKGFEDKV